MAQYKVTRRIETLLAAGQTRESLENNRRLRLYFDGTDWWAGNRATESEIDRWADRAAAKTQQVSRQENMLPDFENTPAPPARRDRTADRVAALAGLPTPKADGRCHYCGLPLNRRGHCEGCV